MNEDRARMPGFVVHETRGRIRLKLALPPCSRTRFEEIGRLLARQPGVQGVEINALNGSVVVWRGAAFRAECFARAGLDVSIAQAPGIQGPVAPDPRGADLARSLSLALLQSALTKTGLGLYGEIGAACISVLLKA